MQPSAHQLTSNVKFLQKVALWSPDSLVLLLKRSQDSQNRPGKWDLPGGNAEWPESSLSKRDLHRAEIAREVLEETQIVVDSDQFQTPVYVGTHFDKDRELYSIIVGWAVRLETKPDVQLSSEHAEFAWVDLGDLDSYDFGFAGEKNGFIRRTILQSSS